jgi:spoIIIJ-associated protein
MNADPQQILTDLLKHMGFDANVKCEDLPEGPLLDIECEEAGRLIGRQGKTLSSLQFLVNRIVFQKDKESPKCTVDVGGYRGKARDEVVLKAKKAAEKVVRWGGVVELEPMNAFERRIVHNVLKDDPAVETSSVEVDGTRMKAMILRPTN